MKAALALYLARHFAKGKLSEAIFMAIAVAAAVFTTASAVNAAIAFQKESAAFLARPDYLEIQAAPAAFVRSNDEAVERLDEDMARAFSLAPDLASRALEEVPALQSVFSIQQQTFSVGEDAGMAARLQMLAGLGGNVAAGGNFGMMPPPEAAGAFPPDLAGGPPPEGMAEGMEGAIPGGTAGQLPEGIPEELRQFLQQSSQAAPENLETPLLERVPGARVDTAFFSAYKLQLAQGDLFSTQDISQRSPVLVAGANIATQLYEDGQALGKAIRLNGITYTIIGILQPSSAMNNNRSVNDLVFIPLTQFTINTGGRVTSVSSGQLTFMARDAESVQPALDGLQSFLDRETGEGAMRLNSRKSELDERTAVQNTLFGAAFFLAAICVIVAALNLMNSAATHAVKRRKSLGMLRAIGASRANTVLTALLENSFPALAGMLVGLGAALAFAPQSVALLVPFADSASGSFLASLLAALSAAALPLVLGTIPAVFFSRTAPAILVRPE